MGEKRWLFVAALACGLMTSSNAAPANPEPRVYKQPDGSDTPDLFLKGDERYSWMSDAKGYTVIRDNSGWYVYAKKTQTGGLESAGARVGRVNPKKLGLDKQLVHDGALDDDFEDGFEEQQRRNLGGRPETLLCLHHSTTVNPCYLKQLALLVRFADHASRDLPSPEEIDIIFNHNGPTNSGSAAPTGSIADVYRDNSFDTFVMDTHVTPWQLISKTEAYAADGSNGFNTATNRECWAEALEKYYSHLAPNGLDDFDSNNDGYIDGLAIVHSGVAAEANGNDCETGAVLQNRIWSHAVPKSPNFEFLGVNGKDLGGIKVGRFYVFSGVHGYCPANFIPGGKWDTGRIAIGVHEGGHFLGLPDLYGKPGKDNGIGNYGFMGNAYGWDTSQLYPGNMDGYSRSLLGWVTEKVVSYSQTIDVTASCDSDEIYRINHRMETDDSAEYLLIENRYACGLDVKLAHGGVDRSGIAIWYVDHTMLLGKNAGKDVIRYNTNKASDDPAWPGVHGRVSLLQGDGFNQMEKNKNKGDEFDLFRKTSHSYYGPSAYKISNAGVVGNDGSTKAYPNTKSIATGEEKETGIVIEVLDDAQYVMQVKITLFDENGNEVTQGGNGDGNGNSNSGGNGNDTGNGSNSGGDFGLQDDGATSGTLGASGTGSGSANAASAAAAPTTSPPTKAPTVPPTKAPTASPTTSSPTKSPSKAPTKSPTAAPTSKPTRSPTNSPTSKPTYKPTSQLANESSEDNAIENSVPTSNPTGRPTYSPTQPPTKRPTVSPTTSPTARPTTSAPTKNPSYSPTSSPTKAPITPMPTTGAPTSSPTFPQTSFPSAAPTLPRCTNAATAQIKYNDSGVTKIKMCQFINPDENRPQANFCDLKDKFTKGKVYEVCQIECSDYTGCPPRS